MVMRLNLPHDRLVYVTNCVFYSWFMLVYSGAVLESRLWILASGSTQARLPQDSGTNLIRQPPRPLAQGCQQAVLLL